MQGSGAILRPLNLFFLELESYYNLNPKPYSIQPKPKNLNPKPNSLLKA